MLSPIGIISGPMAEHFGRPITEITAGFSWLTLGILAGAAIALVVFDWLKLKRIMVALYCLIAASLLSLTQHDELSLAFIALGLVGVCCGIGLAGAALTISRTYEAKRRASMLVITDSFFSVAGIVCSMVATLLIARELHWAGVYQFVALFAVAIVVLAATSSFPATQASETTAAHKPFTPWPLTVWLCVGSLFLYTMGQYSMLLWMPSYAETALGIPRSQTGQIVSQYWMGMFAAQLFVSWFVLKVGVRRIVLVSASGCTLFSASMWMFADIDALLIMATVWGFANFALLKVVLSFATQMVAVPTARLVAGILFGATLGTALSPWVTSQIVVVADKYSVLLFGTGCFAVMTGLLVVAIRLYQPGRQYQ
jgi:TsgA-like MFS transporter